MSCTDMTDCPSDGHIIRRPELPVQRLFKALTMPVGAVEAS
jgi:hypothetical protein